MTCITFRCWLLRLVSIRFGFVLALCAVPSLQAETPRVFRCGNVYTNQPIPNQSCTPLTGGHVTVIEGTQLKTPVLSATATAPTSPDAAPSAATASAYQVDVQSQRQRDLQAKLLLQTELQKAQARLAELLELWRNGEPERQADEQRQPQKYQERVAQMRTALQRNQADVAGLQRELARLPSPSAAKSTP